ncbi:MAG: divalent-cation tolerance protein CutA [Thioploca sp.]|nr:divalent-cation tolerance protein CutA [Thioploca sp.]
METNSEYQLLLTTCPNMEVAQQLAKYLVTHHLAACINIVPNISSIYEWEDKIITDNEVLLFIKTRQDCYTTIQQTLLQQHPYQVPELIAFSIENGSPHYLSWLDQVVSKASVKATLT